ncbi:hypothetical protein BDB00DRAFT_580441 [Zychaea mexicana]|uniref:uncharacterized protein n=1 Tax=Zychaea mexicana TaxID=64656 RepID=UPI0022FDB9DD|nr:uncharacterized protein BDB00DRAFT_580441 [Zychaea mexicana]KAI9497557.1 hypothetical protein BDB00DRAFT_580441 [Zychaea mexicana]
MSNEQNVANLLSNFLTLIMEFKKEMKEGFKSIGTKIDALQAEQSNALGKINLEFDAVKEKFNQQLEIVNSASMLEKHQQQNYPRAASDDNPFAKKTLKRVAMEPRKSNGKAITTFNWQYFEALAKDVLTTQLNQPWKDYYLSTFKKNVTTFADSIVFDLRKRYTTQSSPSDTWCDVPKNVQSESMVLLEDVVNDEFPLKACVEHWGARLLMVRAFQRCKGKGVIVADQEINNIRYAVQLSSYNLLNIFN